MKKEETFEMELVTEEQKFAVPCKAPTCSMNISEISDVTRPFFRDSVMGRTYCKPCGQRLRYHRKKAAQRGTTSPRTIEEAEELLDSLLRINKRLNA